MNKIIKLVKSYNFTKKKYEANLNKLVNISSVLFGFLVLLGIGIKMLPIFFIFTPLVVSYALMSVANKFKQHLPTEQRDILDKIKTELALPENKERVIIIKDIIELMNDDVLEDNSCVTTEYFIKDILFNEDEYQKYASVELNKLIKIRDDLVAEKLNDLTKTKSVLEQKLSNNKPAENEAKIFQINKKYLNNKL
jgi:hypothetical protein